MAHQRRQTIAKVRRVKGRWKLTLACGHVVLWSGEKPAVGSAIDCPAHPIAVS